MYEGGTKKGGEALCKQVSKSMHKARALSGSCNGESNARGLGANSSFAPGQQCITASFALPHSSHLQNKDSQNL